MEGARLPLPSLTLLKTACDRYFSTSEPFDDYLLNSVVPTLIETKVDLYRDLNLRTINCSYRVLIHVLNILSI